MAGVSLCLAGITKSVPGVLANGDDRAALKPIKMQGGVFGSVSDSQALIRPLGPLVRA